MASETVLKEVTEVRTVLVVYSDKTTRGKEGGVEGRMGFLTQAGRLFLMPARPPEDLIREASPELARQVAESMGQVPQKAPRATSKAAQARKRSANPDDAGTQA